MTSINIKANFDKVLAGLKDVQQKQIPFASSRALNALAMTVKAEMTAEIPKVFTHTTPFTRNAIGAKMSNKADLEANVYVKPIQASYLGLEVTGGPRVPATGNVLVIPTKAAPLNSSGNLPRNYVKQKAGTKNFFILDLHGVYGLWKRTGRGKDAKLTLMARFVKEGVTKPKWPFYEDAKKIVLRDAEKIFARTFAEAMATAKP